VGCQLHNIRCVFLRSSVDGKPMETVALSAGGTFVPLILETSVCGEVAGEQIFIAHDLTQATNSVRPPA
jgi:hypothetical protein